MKRSPAFFYICLSTLGRILADLAASSADASGAAQKKKKNVKEKKNEGSIEEKCVREMESTVIPGSLSFDVRE